MTLAQRIALAGLLLCLALAQSLSLAHRTLHHDLRMLAHAHEEQQAAHAHGDDCNHGVFSRLFASHDAGDESCRVLDGANADSDRNAAPALVHPVFHAIYIIANGALSASLKPVAGFKARAPPLLFL
jgi:hypothetical protein